MNNKMVPVGHNLTVTPQTSLADCPTSLDMTNDIHRTWMIAAGNPADIDFDSDGILIIDAVHWLVMPEQREDPETGEIRDVASLILFTRDGSFARTTSSYAHNRLRAVLDLYSSSDWAAGIRFVITRRASKRGRTYHDIRVRPRCD